MGVPPTPHPPLEPHCTPPYCIIWIPLLYHPLLNHVPLRYLDPLETNVPTET